MRAWRAARLRVLLVLAVCAAKPAGAADVVRQPIHDSLPKQVLLLDIEVNKRDAHVVTRVEASGTHAVVSTADLEESGIVLTEAEKQAGAKIALDGLPGIDARIDDARQVLVLSVAPDRLAPHVFSLRPPQAPTITPAGLGLILGYDISAGTGDFREPIKSSSLATALSGTLFTPMGVLVATGLYQLQHESDRFVRLDTTAEFDDPSRVRRLLLGDFISGSLTWNRPVREAGIQFGTDFTLAPAYTTIPLPDFFGQTAVPATVDVYINSVRVFETDTAPGPFELHDLPVLTGIGDVQVVVRDALGRETVQTLSLYATDELLSEGLWSYTFDAGFLRERYGLKSFAYGPFATTATAAYGLTSWLTLSAHGEASDNIRLLGGGAAISLAPFGAIAADAAVGSNGSTVGLVFERRSRTLSFLGSWTETSREFRDIASVGSPLPPRERLQLGASYAFLGTNALAASYIDVHDPASGRTEIATTSYTRSMSGWYFGATGLYDIAHRSWSAEAFLSITVDGLIGSLDGNASDNATSVRATLVKPANPDGGFGYRAFASDAKMESGGGGFSWYGEEGHVDADVAETNGIVSSQVLASGGLVLFGDSLHATQTPEGAVALVKTGLPNVRVERENREVAVTDSSGEALITHLTPYAPNNIAVDPRDFPIASVLDSTQKTVAPPRESGVIVDFSPKITWPVLMSVVLANGDYPPAGANATVEGIQTPLVVGKHGQIFIDDLEGPAKGDVDWGTGHCHFAIVRAQSVSGRITKIGPVACSEGGH